MLASDLKKMRVYASGMAEVGKVKDLEINPDTRTVTALIVGVSKQTAKMIVGGTLRVRGSSVLIPIALVDKVKDAVILKPAINELRGQVQQA